MASWGRASRGPSILPDLEHAIYTERDTTGTNQKTELRKQKRKHTKANKKNSKHLQYCSLSIYIYIYIYIYVCICTCTYMHSCMHIFTNNFCLHIQGNSARGSTPGLTCLEHAKLARSVHQYTRTASHHGPATAKSRQAQPKIAIQIYFLAKYKSNAVPQKSKVPPAENLLLGHLLPPKWPKNSPKYYLWTIRAPFRDQKMLHYKKTQFLETFLEHLGSKLGVPNQSKSFVWLRNEETLKHTQLPTNT